jgi:hypothetical protein
MILTSSKGFRSFQSGHACSAFSGLFFLSLYLAAKLRIADQRSDFWRSFIVLLRVLAAGCVAVTRIVDARHHGFDVIFGSAFGILCAWVSHRQYFPPVSHTWKEGAAHPMKAWGKPACRPMPDGLTLADPEKLEALEEGHALADGNAKPSIDDSAMTLASQTSACSQQQAPVVPNIAENCALAMGRTPRDRSDLTRLSSASSVDIEPAQYAYVTRYPTFTAPVRYPPQQRKPVPAPSRSYGPIPA